MVCHLVSTDSPTIIKHRWVGYAPRIDETIKQSNGQRWLIKGVELAWNTDGEYLLLTAIQLSA